jgi:hypothetical protein
MKRTLWPIAAAAIVLLACIPAGLLAAQSGTLDGATFTVDRSLGDPPAGADEDGEDQCGGDGDSIHGFKGERGVGGAQALADVPTVYHEVLRSWWGPIFWIR